MHAQPSAFLRDESTRRKDATIGALGHTTSNKKLLVTKGIATRSKDATRGSRPYY